VSNLLRPILQSFLLPFHGLKTLHGAIVSKGGHTIFLMGSGGSGKSTTTAQLMRDGYDLISDDGPFFTIDGTAAIAMSSLDFLHVTKNTLDIATSHPADTCIQVIALDAANRASTASGPICGSAP